VIREIIDAFGDHGGITTLVATSGVAVDASGNVFVAGYLSDNMWKITPAGVITLIIDSGGDLAGNTLDGPRGVTVDANGAVYVTGSLTNNAFRITPSGVITQIIDSTGDGAGNPLENTVSIAVSSSGNVYVNGSESNNAFEIEPLCGDGFVAVSESCDDLGAVAGDGCDAACLIEPGWVCVGEPSVCALLVPALRGQWVIVLCLAILAASVLALPTGRHRELGANRAR